MLARRQHVPIKEFPLQGVKKLKSEFFTFKIAANQLAINRFAVIIGKKTAKKAVDRHRIKRMIIGKLLDWPTKGKDVVIVCQANLETVQKKKLEEEINKGKTIL